MDSFDLNSTIFKSVCETWLTRSLVCETRLIHMWNMTRWYHLNASSQFDLVEIGVCDMTHLEWCVRHGTSICSVCETWLIHMFYVHSYVLCSNIIHIFYVLTWLIHMFYVLNKWIVHVCDMMPAHVWHDPSVCVYDPYIRALSFHGVVIRFSSQTHEQVMSHVWISHVRHVNESCAPKCQRVL